MSRQKWLRVLVVTAGAACLLLFSGIVSAQGNSANAFERVKQVQEQHTDRLMAQPGVVGTAISEDPDTQPIMLVLVEHGAVPGIPQQLQGVRVRPLVTGRIQALKPPAKPPAIDPTARFDRPVPIGVSTGHPAMTAGTIGCRVKDAAGNLYALSNNHVYASQNNAGIGDPVIQPGTYDDGVSPADDIGKLAKFVAIGFYDPDYPPAIIPLNNIDAAIAAILPTSATDLRPRVSNATPSNGYGKPLTTYTGKTATINMPVKKYGRTTGLTKGKVYAVSVTVDVGYSDQEVARFVNQILIIPGTFSSGGDSGSLIVGDVVRKDKTNDRMAVGLLFAGSSTVTIANPIFPVLDAFGVSIDGQ